MPESLVVAGDFSGVGGIPADDIAAWDGSSWFTFAGSPPFNGINTLMNYNGQLLAGGSVGGGLGPVMQWNGSAWETFEAIAGTDCTFLGTYNGALVAIGSFTDPDGVTREQTRVWNGQWQTILNAAPTSVAEVDGQLYRPSSSMTPLFKWNGTSWSAVLHGGSMTEFVGYYVTKHDGRIVVGGQYTTIPSPYGVLQRLDADCCWGGLPGISTRVSKLASVDGELYVLSHETWASDFCSIRRWTGTQWAPMGQDIQRAHGIVEFNDRTFAYGEFRSADHRASAGLASWSGTRWDPIAGFQGMTGSVNAIVEFRGETVIGGPVHVDAAADARLIRWDGARWQSLLPIPVTKDPETLAVHQNDLFISTRSELTPGYRLHRWNGQELTPIPGSYRTLIDVDGRLFGFGNSVEEYVNGQWAPLGGSFNAEILDLKSFNDSLYAAGKFTMYGSTLMRYVARWDGSAWVPVPGLGHANVTPSQSKGISRLEVFNGELYAAGEVYWPGAQDFRTLFVTDGVGWRTVEAFGGNGLDFTMLADRDRLLVLRSSSSTHTIYVWDGQSLTAMATTSTAYPSFAHLHRAPGSIILTNTSAINGAPMNVVARLSTASCCASADFDNDGEPGTDSDIQAFFACLAGNCCSECWHLGADFNADGDSGTDADIEAFFRVLAGGTC